MDYLQNINTAEGGALLKQILLTAHPIATLTFWLTHRILVLCPKWYCYSVKLTFSESRFVTAGPVTQSWPILFYKMNSFKVAGTAHRPFVPLAFHLLLP